MFCPTGQNELDIKECDAQIPQTIKKLRALNYVQGDNRLTAVIEDTLFIPAKSLPLSLHISNDLLAQFNRIRINIH